MQLSVQKPQAYLDWKDYGGGQSCPWGRIGGDSDTKEMDSRTLWVRRNVRGRRGLGAIQSRLLRSRLWEEQVKLYVWDVYVCAERGR